MHRPPDIKGCLTPGPRVAYPPYEIFQRNEIPAIYLPIGPGLKFGQAKGKSNVCLFIAFSYSNFFNLTPDPSRATQHSQIQLLLIAVPVFTRIRAQGPSPISRYAPLLAPSVKGHLTRDHRVISRACERAPMISAQV